MLGKMAGLGLEKVGKGHRPGRTSLQAGATGGCPEATLHALHACTQHAWVRPRCLQGCILTTVLVVFLLLLQKPGPPPPLLPSFDLAGIAKHIKGKVTKKLHE